MSREENKPKLSFDVRFLGENDFQVLHWKEWFCNFPNCHPLLHYCPSATRLLGGHWQIPHREHCLQWCWSCVVQEGWRINSPTYQVVWLASLTLTFQHGIWRKPPGSAEGERVPRPAMTNQSCWLLPDPVAQRWWQTEQCFCLIIELFLEGNVIAFLNMPIFEENTYIILSTQCHTMEVEVLIITLIVDVTFYSTPLIRIGIGLGHLQPCSQNIQNLYPHGKWKVNITTLRVIQLKYYTVCL